MEEKKNAGFMNYLPLMIMTIFVFTSASLVFTFVLKDSSPVPVFIFFATVQVLSMLFFVLLPERKKHWARKVSMILIGSTIVFLAGLMARQNFQVEGFIFLLLGGVLGGPVIHFIMKISGTLFTGRSWCSWGCWTAAVLDFLPFENGTLWINRSTPRIRYIHLTLSVLLVAVLYGLFNYRLTDSPADPSTGSTGNIQIVYWFIAGNVLYYAAAVVLAFMVKDNRAFCKYLCPVAVLLKIPGLCSLSRIEGMDSGCSGCMKCEEKCPASIRVHSYICNAERVKSTECMLCLNCVAACPEGNLKVSLGLDLVSGEKLNYRQEKKSRGN